MNSSPVLFALDALTGALFLLTALGVVATRQVLASLQLFILQSLLSLSLLSERVVVLAQRAPKIHSGLYAGAPKRRRSALPRQRGATPRHSSVKILTSQRGGLYNA